MKGMVDEKRGEAVMTFSLALYRREAIELAARLLARRAECFEENSPKGALRVVLKPAAGAEGAGLEALAGDFLCEALNQECRLDVAKTNGPVQRLLVTQALYAASQPPPAAACGAAAGAAAPETPK